MHIIRTLCMAASLAALAHAGSIQFVQHGWSSGGLLTVRFDGADANRDGVIEQLELSLFDAVYTPPAGSNIAWGLVDIQPDAFFFTDLDNFLIFAANPTYSIVDSAFEGEALATIFDSPLFPIDSTSAPAVAGSAGTRPAWSSRARLSYCFLRHGDMFAAPALTEVAHESAPPSMDLLTLRRCSPLSALWPSPNATGRLCSSRKPSAETDGPVPPATARLRAQSRRRTRNAASSRTVSTPYFGTMAPTMARATASCECSPRRPS